MTHQPGSAYVHSMREGVGPADFFLSYAWDYMLSDILSSLEGFCTMQGLDRKSTHVWICSLW
jgi:hypothetical protein